MSAETPPKKIEDPHHSVDRCIAVHPSRHRWHVGRRLLLFTRNAESYQRSGRRRKIISRSSGNPAGVALAERSDCSSSEPCIKANAKKLASNYIPIEYNRRLHEENL